MMKSDFLDSIRKGLSSLSEDDINKSIRYYSEMIDDRIEDGISEEDAVAAMGEPEAVIAEILKDAEIVNNEDEPEEEPKTESINPASSAEKTEKRRKKRKTLPIIAVTVTVLLFLVAAAMFMPLIKNGFNKDALLSSYGYFAVDSDTSAISDFESIMISEGISDVIILPSETEDCLVRFTSIEDVHRYCEIGNDGTLYISYIDNRNWFERLGGFWYEDSTVTLYLPHSDYYKLEIDVKSSDVFVSEEFVFQYVEINTSSGDIDFRADVGDMNAELKAELKSTSGDITLSNITKGGFTIESTSGDITLNNMYLCEKVNINNDDIANELNNIYDNFAQTVGITIKTTSGDVEINDVRTIELFIETSSGDIELNDVYNYLALQVESTSGEIDADNTMSLASVSFDTTSGDISFEGLDSYAGIFLESTSGDIDGYIDSNCYFSVKTASGTVNVPQNNGESAPNGRPLHHCSVTTVSGNINIRTPQ